MDTTISFDMIIQKLTEDGISREQIRVLHDDIFADGRADALTYYASLAISDKLRMAADFVLADSAKVIKNDIDKLPVPKSLHADIITGSPGTGKSYLSQAILRTRNESVYICGDELKRVFISLAKQDALLSRVPLFTDADSIHSFTSDANWNILNYAIAQRKNIVLEMIGSDSITDAKMIRDMESAGYTVHLSHVYANLEKAVYAAVKRRFDPNSTDYGRSVAINKIVDIARKTEREFIKTVELLKTVGSQCVVSAYDNSNWTMHKEAEDKAIKISLAELPSHGTGTDFNLGTKPWFIGENHTSDLLLFKNDADGDLSVALIKRSRPPFDGYYAFPGGFINTSAHRDTPFVMDIESPLEAAIRETQEEMGIHTDDLLNMTFYEMPVYSDRQRDPRNIAIGNNGEPAGRWVVSHPFVSFTKDDTELHGGDDASSAEWVKVSSILNNKVSLAFDHHKILADALSTQAVLAMLNLNEHKDSQTDMKKLKP